MTPDQLQRSIAHKRQQKEHFQAVSRGKRIQRFANAARRGQLTNRQKAFLARKNQIAQAQRIQAIKNQPKITMDNYFDRIFVLNMERQMDKWYNMVRRLKELGITNYERFNGIDGYSEPYLSQWTRYSKKPWNRFDKKYGRKAIRSPGVWGILNGMKKMFLVAKKRGYKNFLVLQDDAIFHHNFTALFDQKMKKLPRWKMLFLGVTQYMHTRDMLNAKDFYHPIGMADGAFAVAFDASIYDFIIKQINLFIMPFDSGPLMTVQRTFMRECFVVSPLLVIADVRSSSCRSGRDQEKFCKKVKWNYSNFIEFTKIPDAPLVSVIMVTENSAKYVEDAVYSIIHQTYPNIEFIVLDNASEDKTVSIIRGIKSNKIKLYASKKKMPTSVYKNMGMMVAKGHAITFQDPDCKSISTRLQKQLILLKRNNGAVTVGYREDINGSLEQSASSIMVAKKVIDEIGYMENSESGAEYEYYQKIKHCQMPHSAINEIFYIPYRALAENLDDRESLSSERKQQIDKYHDWLNSKAGPKYRPFPPNKKDGQALDLPNIKEVLQHS